MHASWWMYLTKLIFCAAAHKLHEDWLSGSVILFPYIVAPSVT
jgi:hypothetical protein